MPRTHRPYPPEFKAEAVRLARGSEKSLPALAADLGISSEALRHWLRQADADDGRGQPGDLTTDEREELRRLRRENQVLRQEREILKNGPARGTPRPMKMGAILGRGGWGARLWLFGAAGAREKYSPDAAPSTLPCRHEHAGESCLLPASRPAATASCRRGRECHGCAVSAVCCDRRP